MSVLHLIAAPSAVDTCLKAAAAGDAVLLLGDGAYAGGDGRLAALGLEVAVLAEDAASRGVAAPAAIKQVAYEDFVSLVVAHDVSVTWA